jgi:hypothetical protein
MNSFATFQLQVIVDIIKHRLIQRKWWSYIGDFVKSVHEHAAIVVKVTKKELAFPLRVSGFILVTPASAIQDVLKWHQISCFQHL